MLYLVYPAVTDAGRNMSTVTLELDLPDDWVEFRLPPALDARLTTLLDQQDRSGSLAQSERLEAEALCNLVDMLALLKLRVERAASRSES